MIPTVADLFFVCVDFNTERMMCKSKIILFNWELLDAGGTKELRRQIVSNGETWDLETLGSHCHLGLGGGKESTKYLITMTDK